LVGLFEALGVERANARRLAASIADWTRPVPKTAARAAGAVRQTGAAGVTPPHRPLESLDELMLVPGMTPELYVSAAPYLTIYTEDDTPKPASAPDIIVEALALAAREDAAGQQDGGDAVASAASGPPGPAAPSVVNVEVTARDRDGGVFVRRAILRLDSDQPSGFVILAWSREDASP
jgi:general secretion pathway protein K